MTASERPSFVAVSVAAGCGALVAVWRCTTARGPAAGVAAIGTTNSAKLSAAERGLAQLPGLWGSLVVEGVKVPSGVGEMPQDLDETMAGASNRACAALVATPSARIGVGLESGIFRCVSPPISPCFSIEIQNLSSFFPFLHSIRNATGKWCRAGGHTFDVCCCCIRDRETQTDAFGFGSSWRKYHRTHPLLACLNASRV